MKTNTATIDAELGLGSIEEELMEYICAENNNYGVAGGFR